MRFKVSPIYTWHFWLSSC